VRERLGIAVQDSLEWVVEDGKATIYPVHPEFFRHRNTVKAGPGSVERDLQRRRDARVEKYR